ncbi:MAG: transposase [Methylococcales bacterium]
MHLSIDENHKILACELTTPEVGDVSAVPDLLAQIDTPFDTVMADGAYDAENVTQAILNKEPKAKVIIPPHKTAVVSATGDTQRDQHIQEIASKSRIAWQQKTGYGLRNLVELAMLRYKRIFGNTMNGLGMPVSVKI